MATKRQAPEERETKQQPWKRHKPNDHNNRPNHGKKSFKKAHPVNELKSQIRSVRRLLERQDDLPASVRVEKERELQTAQRQLVQAQRAKQRSEMISKYHKIRFFDRQKAERRLKKAKKEVAARGDDAERAELLKKVEDAEVDVQYALNYPLDQHYVSLFPTKRKKDGEEDIEEDATREQGHGNPEMWAMVKKCKAEGTLKDLREGRLTGGLAEDEEPEEPAARNKKTANSKVPSVDDRRKHERQEEEEDVEESDNESGGAFFE